MASLASSDVARFPGHDAIENEIDGAESSKRTGDHQHVDPTGDVEPGGVDGGAENNAGQKNGTDNAIVNLDFVFHGRFETKAVAAAAARWTLCGLDGQTPAVAGSII